VRECVALANGFAVDLKTADQHLDHPVDGLAPPAPNIEGE